MDSGLLEKLLDKDIENSSSYPWSDTNYDSAQAIDIVGPISKSP